MGLAPPQMIGLRLWSTNALIPSKKACKKHPQNTMKVIRQDQILLKFVAPFADTASPDEFLTTQRGGTTIAAIVQRSIRIIGHQGREALEESQALPLQHLADNRRFKISYTAFDYSALFYHLPYSPIKKEIHHIVLLSHPTSFPKLDFRTRGEHHASGILRRAGTEER